MKQSRFVIFTFFVVILCAGCAHERSLGHGKKPVRVDEYQFVNYVKVDEMPYRRRENVILNFDTASQINVPAKLAVISLDNEYAGDSILNPLAAKRDYFNCVVSMPFHTSQGDIDVDEFFGRLNSADMDYVFVFGGGMDFDSHGNIFGLLDLTVIGRFILPGETTTTTGEASGYLIDVKQRKILLQGYSELTKSASGPSARTDGREQKMGDSMREELLGALGRNLLANISERGIE